MARILVFGKQSIEREGLALVLEFAGHRCEISGTLENAAKSLKKEPFDLVLADFFFGEDGAEDFVRTLKKITPSVAIMFLTEDADPSGTRDEVVTYIPSSAAQKLSSQFSVIGRKEAFLVLLPEKDSLGHLSDLPERAGFLNKLAVLYHSQGKHSAAEMLYKRALKLSQKLIGGQKSAEASILNNLARLYHDQKEYSQAEPLYKKSLKIVEKLQGAKSQKVARRLTNLAELYRAQKRNEEAKPLDERRRLIERNAS